MLLLEFLYVNIWYNICIRGSDIVGVDYRKLRLVMAKHKLEWVDIRKQLKLTTKTVGKLKNDEYVDLETLEKICRLLSCQLGDIIEIKEDPS